MTDESSELDESRRRMLQATGAASILGLSGCNALDGTLDPAELVDLSHGVAVGDTTSGTAVFWTRLSGPAPVTVEYTTGESFDGAERVVLEAGSGSDDTRTVRLTDLEPGSQYIYRAWGVTEGVDTDANPPEDDPKVKRGTFRTAPERDAASAVQIAWSGDTYGYGGAPVDPPYEGLAAIAELQPDAFIYLGDTIYADAHTPAGHVSPSMNPEDAREIYRAKYREMRNPDSSVAERTNVQAMLESTTVYSMWDDHEVYNNFDRTHPLLDAGLESFLEYWPIDTHESVTGNQENRLYRSFRWGQHLELFMLDTRQYRDPNDVDPDERSMLGERQREWLIEGLRSTDATFKVVVTSTTLGIVSIDGWTQSGLGYEVERDEILDVIVSEVDNVIVLSGDIHKAQIASFDVTGTIINDFYEASAGPLGAPSDEPNDYYEEFNPYVLYDRGNFRNFGVIEVDENGEHLWIEIRHENGKIAFSQRIHAV